MFCNQCGMNNIDTAKFCSNCGTQLITTPQQIQRQTPKLWNPNAAALLGLLLTPIFSAYIHMKNWQSLGDIKKSKEQKIWFIISLIIPFFYIFIPYLIYLNNPISPILTEDKIRFLINGLSIIFLLAWYFLSGKVQINYCRNKLNNQYYKKNWLGLSLVTILVYSILLSVYFTTSLLVGSKINYPEVFDQKSINIKNQKPWEMDWGQQDSAKQEDNQPNYFDQHKPEVTNEKVDWNQYTPVEDTENVRSSTQSAEQAHYDAILKVHPDALQIVKQPSFQAWIDSQSPEWRKYYNDVADTGNADQVIELLNDYKNNLIH